MFQKAISPQPAPDSHSIPFYLVGVDRVWPEKLDQKSSSPQEKTWHSSKPVVSGLGICIHSEFKSLTQQHGLFTFMALPHFWPKTFALYYEWNFASHYQWWRSKSHYYSLMFLTSQNRIVHTASALPVTSCVANWTGSAETLSYLDFWLYYLSPRR